MLWFLRASKAASMSSCVHDFDPWWCELDCPLCPLELFSPESDWPELPEGISPSSSGVIIIMLSLSAAFFELTLARSDMWLSMSIVSEESIVCSVSNLILTLSQFWISANRSREMGMTPPLLLARFAPEETRHNFRDRGDIYLRRRGGTRKSYSVSPDGTWGSISERCRRRNWTRKDAKWGCVVCPLLRAEQRKSNRDQLSVIRPILIPCPPNDRLHFQPGSLFALTSEGQMEIYVRWMDRVNGRPRSRAIERNKTRWSSAIGIGYTSKCGARESSKSRRVSERELAKECFVAWKASLKVTDQCNKIDVVK